MKQILLGLLVVVLLGGITYFDPLGLGKETAENPDVEIVEKEPTPDWITDEEAVEAAQAVIRRKELEAEETRLEAEIEALRGSLEEVQKELGSFWTPQNVKALIRQTFPEDSSSAIAIANCESGLKPKAYNPNNPDGSTDGGLWQINSVHDETLERLGLDKYDPEDATAYARMLYDRNGWIDWVCAWSKDHLALVTKY